MRPHARRLPRRLTKPRATAPRRKPCAAKLQIEKPAARPIDTASVDPRFGHIRHPKKRAYLIALSRKWNFSDAALAAGVDRDTGWNWRRNRPNDPRFLAAVEQAKEFFIERAEAEMWRRGIDGTEKPVYQQGQLVGTVREFDTTAAIFMFKGALPEKYRERFEHTGAGGGPIAHSVDVALANVPTERLRQIRQWLLEAKGASADSTTGATPAPAPPPDREVAP